MTVPEYGADLCAEYARLVYGGRLDPWTYIAPGAWRGTEWPCTGRREATGTPTEDGPSPVIATIVCSCPCHQPGGTQHELPRLARRTAVHPTDVRNSPCDTC